jgi:hypothetical protein
MLRAADGLSHLTTMGQLRRYLTSTPLGQRTGYETAWRVFVVLRLTGWISLAGQQRDPMTGHVLSELYRAHDGALSFREACALDAFLPALLQTALNHENNQVERVALHIHENLAEVPAASGVDTAKTCHDDDEPPTEKPPPNLDQRPTETAIPCKSASETGVMQQTAVNRQTTLAPDSTCT